MTSRNEKDRAKQIQEKCQTILTQLLKDEDNKYCVDCDAKGPRWASWNLGIFLCIRCAGIHRNLGVHISKVKSVNLDSWTPEQVVSLQQMGNSRARAVYEANLPDSFRRPQTDSALEAFVRAKYEHRKYVAREWVPPSPPQVNWDKEIDEEIERQKKKKKSTSTATLGNSSLSPADKKANKSSEVVPQLLPKPKSSASPKPGRTTPKRESGGTADLLGTSAAPVAVDSKTQIPPPVDDVFTSFLSAPQATPDANKNNKTECKAMDLKTEEESFFNQPAPSEKEKSKMTKDSILALYGQNPSQIMNSSFPTTTQNNSAPFSATFPQPQMFSQPQFPQSVNFGTPMYNSFPCSTVFVPNTTAIHTSAAPSFPLSFNQFGNNQPSNAFGQLPAQQNQFSAQNSFSSAPNSFSGSQGTFGNAPNQFQPATGFPTMNMNGSFLPSNSAVNGQQSLFNNPTNSMQQQFGSMSLGHQATPVMNAFPTSQAGFPAKTQSTMAANSVWQ